MKLLYPLLFACLFIGKWSSTQAQRYWIANSASNWNNTANWSITSGGAGGASVPTTTDLAIFDVNGSGTCTLDLSPTVAGVTCTGAGSIDLAGFNFTTTGTNTFTSGTITNSGAPASVVLSNLTLISTFEGTLFNVNVSGTSGRILFNGSIFNGTVNLIKNNNEFDTGTGNNTFNSSLTLTNNGTGDIRLGSTNPDVYNGEVTLNVSNTGGFSIARAGVGNQFNGNIVINYNSTGGVSFGLLNGTSTLASGKTITIGGIDSGNLSLAQFTQLGATAQSFALTGTSTLTLGPSSTFNGNVDFAAPQLFLSGCTYNGEATLEKTGATNNNGSGGNVFNGLTTIAHSGSGNLVTSNSSKDIFNDDLTLINTGTGIIYLAQNALDNEFNGDIIFNSTGSSGGVLIANSSGGSAKMAAGGSLLTGGMGYSSGSLAIRRFTQLGSEAQTLLLTGSTLLEIGPNSTFNGVTDFRAPKIHLDGCTFNNTTYVEKTGGTNNNSDGGNIFNGTTTIANSGSGDFKFAVINALDTFNENLTINNSGTGGIYMSDVISGTVFNGNVQVNSTSGTGVFFGNGGGNSSQPNGFTLSNGTFSAGTLYISGFTKGTDATTLILTGSSTLTVTNNSTFNGDVTFTAPNVLLNGGIFNGVTNITKADGGSTNNNTGGNTFNQTTTLTNASTSQWRLASTNGDTYNGQITFVKTSTGVLEPAYNGTNTFTSDIIINGNSAITLAGGTGSVQFTGTNSQTISRTGGVFTHTFGSVIMNKASQQVTLATPITINLAATFTSGVLNTDATNILNFVDNATASGANDLSYVDGPVQKTGNDSFDFPVGDGGYYRLISISAPGDATDAFKAQYFKTNPNLGSLPGYFYSISNCEYWQLDRTIGSSNVSVTLSWNTNSCGGITQPSDLRIAKWDGANWIDEGNGGTTGSSSNGTIISGATVSTYGPFTLASATLANPLPIVLEWFKASVTDENKVLIEWRTASEIDNEFFDVERTDNTLDFKSIGRIKGAHNSTKANDYAFVDLLPLSGISYYRLKQTDIDGTFTYSKVVSVMRGEDPFIVFPNPSPRGWVTFNRKMDVVIYNQLNQIVARYTDATGFDTQSWMPGIYIIRTPLGEVIKLVIH